MRNRLGDLSHWLTARQEQVELSSPLSYRNALRYLFWRGLPGFAGPVVVLVGQILINGMTAARVFGGGFGLIACGILTSIAYYKGDRVGAVAFPLGAVALAGLVFRWAGADGFAAWLVFFWVFVTALCAALVFTDFESRLGKRTQPVTG